MSHSLFFRCPACGRKLKVPASLLGKEAGHSCGAQFFVLERMLVQSDALSAGRRLPTPPEASVEESPTPGEAPVTKHAGAGYKAVAPAPDRTSDSVVATAGQTQSWLPHQWYPTVLLGGVIVSIGLTVIALMLTRPRGEALSGRHGEAGPRRDSVGGFVRDAKRPSHREETLPTVAAPGERNQEPPQEGDKLPVMSGSQPPNVHGSRRASANTSAPVAVKKPSPVRLEDRHELFASHSDAYKLGGHEVKGRLIKAGVYRDLARSDDPVVKKIAADMLALCRDREKIEASGRRLEGQETDAARRLQMELFRGAFGGAMDERDGGPPSNPFTGAVGAMHRAGPKIQDVFTSRKDLMKQMAEDSRRVMGLRERIINLAARTAARPLDDPAKLTISFEFDRAGRYVPVVSVVNRTGGDIHNCVVRGILTSGNHMSSPWPTERDLEDAAMGFGLAGVKPGAIIGKDIAQRDLLDVDRGFFAFIPLWKDGDKFKICFDNWRDQFFAQCCEASRWYSRTATVTLCCDEYVLRDRPIDEAMELLGSILKHSRPTPELAEARKCYDAYLKTKREAQGPGNLLRQAPEGMKKVDPAMQDLPGDRRQVPHRAGSRHRQKSPMGLPRGAR